MVLKKGKAEYGNAANINGNSKGSSVPVHKKF
jgi:hypothetical protein